VRIFFIRASGANGFALDDADRGQRTHEFGVQRRGRLLLHHLIEKFIGAEIAGWNGVHHLAAAFVEHGRRRWSDLAELGLAAEKFSDARANAAGLVVVNLECFLDQLCRRLRIAFVLQERAAQEQHAGGAGAGNKEPPLRHRSLIPRRQEEVFPPFAAVGSGQAEISHPAPPEIVEGAQRLGRRLDHHRSLREVDPAQKIHGIGVGRQEERLSIHQFGEDEDFVVLDPDVEKALAAGGHVHTLVGVHERLEGRG
jgi:hypothetical protein